MKYMSVGKVGIAVTDEGECKTCLVGGYDEKFDKKNVAKNGLQFDPVALCEFLGVDVAKAKPAKKPAKKK